MTKKSDAPQTGGDTTKETKTLDASGSATAVVEGDSGAITDAETVASIDTEHPSIDGNPREGTTVDQNARHMNDPRRRKPNDRDFAGQGIDPTPYGRAADTSKKKKK
ncbi:hypothetical protein [Agrobacterium tumefaciens]|uniref:hypothetical protein n=1 Tax=Agrobacterium tumefaciens TaxID=358 RepID=UPI0021D2BC1F|nr:hypothetical protein [Agrobacterium tumefaciens]UXS49281.1 hypothetical protein FY149_18830 [Agrobacterium tumefaciens]